MNFHTNCVGSILINGSCVHTWTRYYVVKHSYRGKGIVLELDERHCRWIIRHVAIELDERHCRWIIRHVAKFYGRNRLICSVLEHHTFHLSKWLKLRRFFIQSLSASSYFDISIALISISYNSFSLNGFVLVWSVLVWCCFIYLFWGGGPLFLWRWSNTRSAYYPNCWLNPNYLIVHPF